MTRSALLPPLTFSPAPPHWTALQAQRDKGVLCESRVTLQDRGSCATVLSSHPIFIPPGRKWRGGIDTCPARLARPSHCRIQPSWVIVTAGLSCSLVAVWEIIQRDFCLCRGRLARSRVAAEVSRASCSPAPRRGETGILAGTAG